MITLPSRPGRIWLVSFWLVISGGTGGLVGVVLALVCTPAWFGLGLLLAGVMAGFGLRWPQIVPKLYQKWNALAYYVAHAACLVLQGLCFYLLFTVVGRMGARLSLDRPDATASLWVPRQTLTPAVSMHPYETHGRESTRKSWIVTYIVWALRSGNDWACCLLPFLLLLRAFEPRPTDSFPTSIYTLY
jgi:hypothetical protein